MQRGSVFGWVVIATVALVTGGWLARGALRAAVMREELAALREESRDLTRLRAENKRLAAESITPAALDALRADRVALLRLRTELEALKAGAKPAPTRAPAPAPGLAPKIIPSVEWKNSGRGTPAASFETAMWAVASANLNVLTDTLVLDGPARQKAANLFATLPADARADIATVERMVAFLTAKDVPVGNMSVLAQMTQGDDKAVLKVLLESPEGVKRMPSFALHRFADGWKLVVPESAIDRYSAQVNDELRPDRSR